MRYFSLAYFDCATSYSLCGLLAARRGGMCWLVFVLIAKLSSWTINHQLIHVSRCLNINNIEIKIIPSLEARLFLSELLPEWLFLITGITITIVHSDGYNSDKIAGTITFFSFSMIFSDLFTIWPTWSGSSCLRGLTWLHLSVGPNHPRAVHLKQEQH